MSERKKGALKASLEEVLRLLALLLQKYLLTSTGEFAGEEGRGAEDAASCRAKSDACI